MVLGYYKLNFGRMFQRKDYLQIEVFHHGERLKGDLTAVYSYHLRVMGVEYWIVYQIKEQEIVVVVLQIGTCENFYAELKKG